MATMRDLLAIKGTRVALIGPAATVYEAAVLMNENKIGSLVVVDEDQLVGIITERDILQRVVAQCLDAAATRVADILTSELVCGQVHTTVEEARGVMKNRRIRHLPIVDDLGRLLGLVSIGDLNAFESNSQELTIHFLHEYIHGRV